MGTESLSQAEQLALLGPEAWHELIDILGEEHVRGLLTSWAFWGRPKQQEPDGDWLEWLLLTGRGFGKTRTGAEWCYKRACEGAVPGGLLGRTYRDVVKVMIHGEAGLLATAAWHGTPWKYEPTKQHVLDHMGGTWTIYTSEKPDQLRGPEHMTLWVDEFAALKATVGVDGLSAFDNARFTLRSLKGGVQPRALLTTTPKRVKAVKDMLADAANPEKRIHVTRGSMLENRANLAASFIDGIVSQYGGTALAQQEIEGLLAAAVEGALWDEAMLNRTRIVDPRDLPELARPIIAIDPSVGDGSGDECGISVQALSAGTMPTEMKHGNLSVVRNVRHGYVLEDGSMAGSPDAWADRACELAEEYGVLEIVAEGNQGGEMIRPLIRSRNASLRVKIVHARVGKAARAQPVAGLYAQGRWHHVGEFGELESQQMTWRPGIDKESPDRLDALVWGATHLEPSVGKSDQYVQASTGWGKRTVNTAK